MNSQIPCIKTLTGLVVIQVLWALVACEDAMTMDDAQDDPDASVFDVTSESQALYQLGNLWPGGIVDVCYDGTFGNNPVLIEETRKAVENSWGMAANIEFRGWGACNPGPFRDPKSRVKIKFAPNVGSCASDLGRVEAFRLPNQTLYQPGENIILLDSANTGNNYYDFHYVAIHEFGHALGFAHEQERPDNWDENNHWIYCGEVQDDRTWMWHPGAEYLTDVFDRESIMSYCNHRPDRLGRLDIIGVQKAYGAKSQDHGFMILSDTNRHLAIRATSTPTNGSLLWLASDCNKNKPECTWSYRDGMLVSDYDPILVINAWGGAKYGTYLRLSNECTPANPDCTWTLKNGMFYSDRDPSLAVNAYNGAAPGSYIRLHNGCAASNPDCTWTLPDVKLTTTENPRLAVNAWGGANHGTYLRLYDGCPVDNPDCTWTVSKGEFRSSRDSNLAINATGGAAQSGYVRLHNGCTTANPDCTWTWTKGRVLSDKNRGLGMSTEYSPVQQGSYLKLSSFNQLKFNGLFSKP